MENEKINEYTRRITQSNRSGLLVIMYEIAGTYLEDAKNCLEKGEKEAFKENVRNADRVVRELQEILDFKYELSGNLYSLYAYCRRALAKSLTMQSTQGIDEAGKILSRLEASYRKLAEQDESEPLMKHAGQVYAGITYGKKDLTENYNDRLEASRGFFA